MKTRMQPIGNIWSKFPRVVRDLSLSLAKQVRVEMEGEDTELDKTIVEAIKDPLTHLVRNAVDHAIEPPAERIAAGKPSEGTISLRAYHEGGQVNIEIADDGRGIDAAQVLAKATERGLVPRDAAERLAEREVLSLIFAPGFSTAARVTNVSGRGVGMDVVKTNIERIGGTVDIATVLGGGTTVKVKIPLTLAIIPALIVSAGAERYAIPQASLLELVRLEGEQACRGIETVSGAPVHRLRGDLLPLVHFNRELGLAGPGGTELVNIVVLQADRNQFGLVVDRVHDTQEIVVKPLGTQLKGIATYAGATILGDGKVALILDVLGLAQRAGVVAEKRDRAVTAAAAPSGETAEDRESLLIVGLGPDRRVAVPLSTVARLEKFPLSTVERAAQGEVIQYRDAILPLVSLSAALGVRSEQAVAADGTFDVVVHTSSTGRSVGLVVDRILDIVEQERRRADPRAPREGDGHAVVVDRRVTDVLDVPALVAAFAPGLLADPEPLGAATAAP
jgi:two-component system chemotaxis sensor kinase CheA